MSIAPLLKRFVSDELARSNALAEAVHSGTVQALRDTKFEAATAGGERANQLQLIEALQRHAAAWRKAFVDTLREKVVEGLKEEQDEAAQASSGAGLQLMDETLVEVDIEISRAMQLIDTTAEWELRELQTFTSTLKGQGHVSAESNPLRPLMYATALWEAACVVVTAQVQRATLLRASATALAGQLKLAWAAACTRLESQGVEPGVYRTVLLPTGSPVGRAAAAQAQRPGALGGLLNSMPVAAPSGAPGRQVASGASATPRTATRPAGVNPQIEAALRHMEQLLSQPAGGAAPGAPPARRMSDHRQALLASADQLIERQTIELLLRLFEVMLSDTGLPPAYRSVLGRLQPSALRVALADPSMMTTHQHPVWQMVDRIGDASVAYSQPTDPRGAALLAACRNMAERLARAPTPDAALYRRGVERLDAFVASQFEAQLAQARPAIDALERAERRDVLQNSLAERLAEQMAPLRTPPGVRRFVLATWSTVMAEAMLRFGEHEEPTPGFIKAVDELLWSVQLPDHPQSRQRLLALLPGLLQRLRAGMALIALPRAEQQALLDELMVIHAEALRPGARGGAGAPTAAELVQRMRDEVLPDAPGASAAPDSMIDLASMETVPAELMMTHEAPAADALGKSIDALRPAAGVRLFLLGRWQRTQLLWHSPRHKTFIFTGDNPLRRHSITRRALERLYEAGLVQPLSPTSLSQRAVEVLTKQLERSA